MALGVGLKAGKKFGQRRFWLFQYRVDDPIDGLRPRESYEWQGRKEMQPGDGIVLWKPGKDSGIFGFGEIAKDPFEKVFWPPFRLTVDWKCVHVFPGIVPRQILHQRVRLREILVVEGKGFGRGVFSISTEQWSEIQRLSKSYKAETPNADVKKVSVERMLKEFSTVEQKLATRTVLQSERSLLRSYTAHMKAKGFQFESRKIRPLGEPNYIRCDLYEPKRGVLFEAKGSPTREAIRMEIGELLDYGRFIQPIPSLAVLLPERPSDDLEKLLTGQKIKLVWRTGNGFVDNTAGQLS